MLTMMLGGLWHGASWRFVAWGGLHGVYLTGERTLGKRWETMLWLEHGLVRFGLALLTWLLVCLSWVFFRAPDFSSAMHLLRVMFAVPRPHHIVTAADGAHVLTVTAALLVGQWLLRDTTLEQVAGRLPRWIFAGCLSFMLLALFLVPGDERAFIYFQF